MKLRHYLSLIIVLAAFLFASQAFGKNNGNDNKNKKKNQENKNSNQQQQSKPQVNQNNNKQHQNKADYTHERHYTYKGKYQNFKNNNHHNRYYFHGKYYNFKDYYRNYSHENNLYTFEGTYGKHGNIFIFSDRYGNEFDVYLKPVHSPPGWSKGRPLKVGKSYKMRIYPTRMYPTSDELRVGLGLSFGWGNLTLTNGKYYDMFIAPQAVNVGGRLYY